MPEAIPAAAVVLVVGAQRAGAKVAALEGLLRATGGNNDTENSKKFLAKIVYMYIYPVYTR
jgi:hypothetical protein